MSSNLPTNLALVGGKEWTVVGAGPAGIVCIASLLDGGVVPSQIVWVDPEFKVGRMIRYTTVPGNNKARQVLEFLEAFRTFRECRHEASKANMWSKSYEVSNLLVAETQLKHFEKEKEYNLGFTRSALQGLTECLCKKVSCKKDTVIGLFQVGVPARGWTVQLGNHYEHFFSKRVVLATGSRPIVLDEVLGSNWQQNIPSINDNNNNKNKIVEIPYDVALDRLRLESLLSSEDTVLILGSAQSALLALKYVFESKKGVKKIINLWKHPIVFAEDKGGWIQNDAKGLKGDTARWFKAVSETSADYAQRVVRLENTTDNLLQALQTATKVICAVGFRHNKLPTIKLSTGARERVGPANKTVDISEQLDYDKKTGEVHLLPADRNVNGFPTNGSPHNTVLGPTVSFLYCLGIGFPELHTTPDGKSQLRVGIPGFIDYAKRIVPAWIANKD